MTANTKRKLTPLIDEFGELQADLEKYKKAHKRAEQLRRAITSELGLEPYEETSVAGQAFVVEIGPQEERKVIKSKRRLKTALGERKFIELASFTLKALTAALSAAQIERLVELQRIGPRKVTVRAKD